MGEIIKFENDMNKINLGGLSKNSLNLFWALCYLMREKGMSTVTFSYAEIKKLAKFSDRHTITTAHGDISAFSREVDTLATELQKISVRLKNNAETSYFVLFPTMIANDDKQTLKVRINADFMYLLNEFANYTMMSLLEVVNFKSKYTKNLFRLLKQYADDREETSWYRVGSSQIDEFRSMLGCPVEYRNTDFRRNCLFPAIKEINSIEGGSIFNLSCEISYDERAKGKPMSHLYFKWNNRKQRLREDSANIEKDIEKNDDAVIEAIRARYKEAGISDERFKEMLEYALRHVSRRDNLTAYMDKMLVAECEKKSDGKQVGLRREYDFSKIVPDNELDNEVISVEHSEQAEQTEQEDPASASEPELNTLEWYIWATRQLKESER